jgi:hypothetical protein
MSYPILAAITQPIVHPARWLLVRLGGFTAIRERKAKVPLFVAVPVWITRSTWLQPLELATSYH